ncbi:MAG: tRNA dihydrouridine synthase DusB [Gammaproteobacteria bacterium]|jgi:tRNA-dihydrouridine synthase B|nr:tRNA dihydrouridine synthase DusB [Gammaproteobacteria bacterium]
MTDFGFHLADRFIPTRCLVAPMAGVTDLPFRQLCKQLGAVYAVAEMSAANPALQHTRKSMLRRQHDNEPAPVVVQIAGAVPDYLATAAMFNVRHGAEIIDINMGCPAKKVCARQAGSALLADEPLVARILQAVRKAVTVPVTLKIRLGSDVENQNAVRIARLAELSGIDMLTVHGRTRAQKYTGSVNYDAIREVVETVSIPVIANGDILSAQQASEVLQHTGAAAVMIGRAGQGNPWLYAAVDQYLQHGRLPKAPSADQRCQVLLQHVQNLHAFYGCAQGLRVARKHIGWYLRTLPGDTAALAQLLRVEQPELQLRLLERLLLQRADGHADALPLDFYQPPAVPTMSIAA